jgi:hypothetical protein
MKLNISIRNGEQAYPFRHFLLFSLKATYIPIKKTSWERSDKRRSPSEQHFGGRNKLDIALLKWKLGPVYQGDQMILNKTSL